MTALAQDRKTDQLGIDPLPGLLSIPVEADTIIYGGDIVATNAAGNAVPASAISALKCWGRCEVTKDNRTVAHGGPGPLPGGTAGLVNVEVKQGVFYFANSTGAAACGLTTLGQYVYSAGGAVASALDAAGTLPLLGVMYPGGASTGLRADGQVAVFIGGATPYQTNPELAAGTSAFRARNVAAAGNVAALTAFTVAGNDGVTNVAGDVVVLLEQTTVAQNGPYVVGSVATGTAPLTRPDWWPAGAALFSGTVIRLGAEGTVFKNTSFRAMVAADSLVVGTTDPKLYPAEVSGVTQLGAGTFTISTVPIFSANTQVELFRKIGNTCTLTVGGYHPTTGGATGITPGIRGTAAVIVEACVAAGSINNVDVSTLHWTVINQA